MQHEKHTDIVLTRSNDGKYWVLRCSPHGVECLIELRCRHNAVDNDQRAFLWKDGDEFEVLSDEEFATFKQNMREHEGDEAVDGFMKNSFGEPGGVVHYTFVRNVYSTNVVGTIESMKQYWTALKVFVQLEYTH